MFEVNDTVRDLVTKELVKITRVITFGKDHEYYVEFANGDYDIRSEDELDFATAKH